MPLIWLFISALMHGAAAQNTPEPSQQVLLDFQELPNLPDAIGVAGPIVGTVDMELGGDLRQVVIVGGGANFARPNDPQLWELPKKYHDHVYILDGSSGSPQWIGASGDMRLSQPVAYASVVSTKFGLLVLGGEDQSGATNRTFLLRAERSSEGTWKIVEDDARVPDLPVACTAGGAAVVDDYVYVIAGLASADGRAKSSASRLVWRLRMDRLREDRNEPPDWEPIVGWPGQPCMYPLVTSQHDGVGNRLYLFGGRRFLGINEPGYVNDDDDRSLHNLQFSSDGWSFDPARFDASQFNPDAGSYGGESPWTKLANSPVPLSAGTAVPLGPAHVLIPSYATGDILKDWLKSGTPQSDYEHPGFPRTAWSYHTVTDTWTSFGTTPVNAVTTPAIRWGKDVLLISGEVRPRVRTNRAWSIFPVSRSQDFGTVNSVIVVVYLIAMLFVGVWAALRNRTTDDYFRGGKQIPWWVAGCSIFATMLSSITYMAIPAKAFAQDWVYSIGNVCILAIAPVAVYVAMPFFRKIDATSAYEYLEKRFSRTLRLIGSGSFALFHVFRMGVVLALAALALASVTPLSPTQCVVVMGLLSIIYCTIGGIEAVVWTDTIQTFILMGGAIVCLVVAFAGSSSGSLSAALEAGKFDLVQWDFGPTSFTTMAIWVVILGGLGQNLASYTADQAVVQRYMTTADERQAARSIWLNALMAIPAAIIFFGLGTTLWMFYRAHPDRLDPTMASDRILAHFISQEVPIGVAGLVVAGIFAAAQSTVSTSMNSSATTIVTDFLRPFWSGFSDQGILWAARFITLTMGVLGTLTGFLFVDPQIRSLFDEFIGILGMFFGTLAGLFALGATTRRGNAWGGLVGAVTSLTIMISIALASQEVTVFGIDVRACWQRVLGFDAYRVHGYLYAFIGITICYVVGYLASCVLPGDNRSLNGLVIGWSTKDK